MIALLDTSEDLAICAAELGCAVEQLLTPLTRFAAQDPTAHFAIENGCYKRFDAPAYLALLKREHARQALCRYVSVPDVVGSARRTLEVFEHWYVRQDLQGWPLAYVAQDGQEEIAVPWYPIAAVFIGGSVEWKMSRHAVAVIKAAQALGKWTHVGRVNDPGRFEYFEALGVDSIDGTGLARYTHMRERIARASREPALFSKEQLYAHD